MTRIAGNSAHEVRTWITAYAARRSRSHRPIRELIAGFGLTTGTLD